MKITWNRILLFLALSLVVFVACSFPSVQCGFGNQWNDTFEDNTTDNWTWDYGDFAIVPSNNTDYGNYTLYVGDGCYSYLLYNFSDIYITDSSYGFWFNFSFKADPGADFLIRLLDNSTGLNSQAVEFYSDQSLGIDKVDMYWHQGAYSDWQINYYKIFEGYPGWGSYYGHDLADGNWQDIAIRFVNSPENQYIEGYDQPFAAYLYVNGTACGFFYSGPIIDFGTNTYTDLHTIQINSGSGNVFIDNISVGVELAEPPPPIENLPWLFDIYWIIYFLITALPTLVFWHFVGPVAVIPIFDVMNLVAFIANIVPLQVLIIVLIASLMMYWLGGSNG